MLYTGSLEDLNSVNAYLADVQAWIDAVKVKHEC